ncbi:hypothetical protein B9Z19DRAFT_1063409 [Tuber borchii]|uniref:Uncharacterized protein n=1 Tax=Tuber borchii TaxID=42251 RepID=A0A2T6ZYE1_TUBBO|nr:hypothetical protein B9Z19DRAFT_1063409 [Tuber borchii]
MLSKQPGPTTSIAKRRRIVGLANLDSNQQVSLKEIANETNVPLSTCFDIICFSTIHISETNIPDPCSGENLHPRPTATKGENQALSVEEKTRIITSVSQDAMHCRKPLHELVSESELQIYNKMLTNILSADGTATALYRSPS